MKTKHIILILLCLFIGTNTDAQFFKKLKEKIANGVSGKKVEKQSAETDTLAKNTMGDPIPSPRDNNVKRLIATNCSTTQSWRLKIGREL